MRNNHSGKRVLITSARSPVALELARQFHAAGHEVYAVDSLRLHVCRFSKAVKKGFQVVSPRQNASLFIEQLLKIVADYKIDLIVPIYEEIIYLSLAADRFPPSCKVFADSFDKLHILHNKWFFIQKLKELGWLVPVTTVIKNREDLLHLSNKHSVALKPAYSRASSDVRKWTPGQPLPDIQIEDHNPWIAQEWIEGNQFCSYGIANNGKLSAHAVYPVGYTANGKGCIIFDSVEHQPIKQWIENFVGEMQFTGQIAFDFIESPDGQRLYAIECNPRATSGAFLFGDQGTLAQAFVAEPEEVITPQKNVQRQLMIAMLIYGWKSSACLHNTFNRFFKNLWKVPDVVYHRKDPFPFVSQPISFFEVWYKSRRMGLSLPDFFMHDNEWNGVR